MRDVAIVSVAQTVPRGAATELNEVEMIQPVILEALQKAGVRKGKINFTYSKNSESWKGY